MPTFQSTPRGTCGQRFDTQHRGPDGLPDVDVGVAHNQDVAGRRRATPCTASAIRDSLELGTRWSTRTPSRRSGPGAEAAHGALRGHRCRAGARRRCPPPAGRHPRPSPPVRRRACLPPRSGWPWPPARALPGDLDRARGGALRQQPPSWRTAGTSRIGLAIQQEAEAELEGLGLAAPVLRPRRACRRTFRPGSRRPTQPVWTSSRTRPRSAGTSGQGLGRGGGQVLRAPFWYDIVVLTLVAESPC